MENDVYKTIGKNVYYFRKKLGLTQTELAEKAGLSKTSVNSIESGRRSNLNIKSLVSISNVLEIKIWELFYEIDYEDEEEESESAAELQSSIEKAFYPPVCTYYPITSLMELLIYAPIMDWFDLADSISRIEGDAYNSETYIFDQMSHLKRRIKDSPAYRYASHMYKIYNLKRAGVDVYNAPHIINDTNDEEYEAYKNACLEKRKLFELLRDLKNIKI